MTAMSPVEPKTVTIAVPRLRCNDGIASYIEMLTNQFRSRGWRVTLIAGRVEAPGASIERHKRLEAVMDAWTVDPRLDLGPSAIWTKARALASICRTHRTSIIHLNGRVLGPPCWVQKKWTGIPYVNAMQIALTPADYPGLLGRSLMGRMLGDRYIVISRETEAQAHAQLGVPPDRIRLIFHGCDARFKPPTAAERNEARERLSIPPGQFVCTIVARITPVKRHDLVIAAMSQLRSEGRDIVALCVGEAEPKFQPYFDELKASVAQHGLSDRIRWLGHGDTLPVLRATDVKMLPSDLEGFPISTLEAMACGVVVVRTSAEGAADQIEHGKTGFLFPCGDSKLLADYIRRLQDNPEERATMGINAARVAAERFTSDMMAKNTLDVYQELLAKASTAGRAQAASEVASAAPH